MRIINKCLLTRTPTGWLERDKKIQLFIGSLNSAIHILAAVLVFMALIYAIHALVYPRWPQIRAALRWMHILIFGG
ncbi:MAG: hypothetical protein ABFD76_04990 [Smithella sp.]